MNSGQFKWNISKRPSHCPQCEWEISVWMCVYQVSLHSLYTVPLWSSVFLTHHFWAGWHYTSQNRSTISHTHTSAQPKACGQTHPPRWTPSPTHTTYRHSNARLAEQLLSSSAHTRRLAPARVSFWSPCSRRKTQTGERGLLSFYLSLCRSLGPYVMQFPKCLVSMPQFSKVYSQWSRQATVSLFAEQQWSFVVSLTVDSKLWALCECRGRKTEIGIWQENIIQNSPVCGTWIIFSIFLPFSLSPSLFCGNNQALLGERKATLTDEI